MDPIMRGKALRARRLMEEVAGAGGPSVEDRAKAFVDGAYALMQSSELTSLRSHHSDLVQRAVTGAQTLSDWGDAAGAELAEAYLGSIAERLALDAAMPFARQISSSLSYAIVAGGVDTGTVLEKAPKAVRSINLALEDLTSHKVAAIVVMTAETLSAGGEPLFQRELTQGVARGTNDAFIAALGTPTAVAATGDPLGDLKAGLIASDSSVHYVVITNPGTAAAVRVDARIALNGITVIGHEGQAGMLIVPSERLALVDYGFRVKPAGHASVEMSDTPTGDADLVSLFQTNSRALLAEREFKLLLDGNAVLVS